MINTKGNTYPCFVSARHQCSNDWINGFSQLVNVGGQPKGRPMNFTLLRDFFPEYAKKKALDIQSVTFYLSPKDTIPVSPLTEYKVILNGTTTVIATNSLKSKLISTGARPCWSSYSNSSCLWRLYFRKAHDARRGN